MRNLRIAFAGVAVALGLAASESAWATAPGVAGPIYFADYTTPTGAIARVDPAGGPIFTAVPGPTGSDPAVSPDGSTLAFSRDADLWTVSATGGMPSRVTATPFLDEGQPAWSASGTHLAYAVNDGGVSRIEVIEPANPTAIEVLVVDGGALTHPSFSPDDAKVAYSRTWAGESRVHVVTRATQIAEPVGPPMSSNPDWSPDGAELAYEVVVAGLTYVEIGAPGGVAARLPGRAFSPSFSPVGDAVAVSVPPGRIARVDRGADGAWSTADDVTTSITSGQGYGQRSPAWAGTGQAATRPEISPSVPPAAAPPTGPVAPPRLYPGRIFFDATYHEGAGEIYSIDPSGDTPRRLTRHPGNDSDPDVSRPDQITPQRVAFSRNDHSRLEIWTMRPDGSEQRRFDLGRGNDLKAWDPSWSPDGRTIVFTGTRGRERTSIWVAAEGATAPRRLSEAPVAARGPAVADSNPAVSPDGRTIAFRRTGSDFAPLLCVTPFAGGAVHCSPGREEMARRVPCTQDADDCARYRRELVSLAARGIPAWSGHDIWMTAGVSSSFGRDPRVLPYALYADDDGAGRSVITSDPSGPPSPELIPVVPVRQLSPPLVRYGVPAPDGSAILTLSGANDRASERDFLHLITAGRFSGPITELASRMGAPAWQAVLAPPPTRTVADDRFTDGPALLLQRVEMRGTELAATIHNDESFGVVADVRVSKRARSPIGRICRGTRRTSVFVPAGGRVRVRVSNVARGSGLCLGARDRAGVRRTTPPVRSPR